jgi:DNA-binding response OmpR family regulator
MEPVNLPWVPHVLVVDDNRDAANVLALLLEVWGYQPLVAYRGDVALEVAATQSPHVVLLDIGLPDLDGHEVARRLRRLPGLEKALLVAVTGHGGEEDLCRARETGFDHYLLKPFDPEELLRLLPPLP